MIYGIFSRLDILMDTALSWLPMYYPFKLIFLLWCFLPQYTGALILYHHVLEQMISSKEQAIQSFIDTARRAAAIASRQLQTQVKKNSDVLTAVTTRAQLSVQSHSRELSSLIWSKNDLAANNVSVDKGSESDGQTQSAASENSNDSTSTTQ
jgi:hypothetical protein